MIATIYIIAFTRTTRLQLILKPSC